ncbi:MAG: helix-turn-helix domain-containing protein [Deltaproteobacteria bacterium]
MKKSLEQRKSITPKEAAEIYGLSEGTLANLRCKKQGCRYYRVGSRKVMYLVSDFEAWLKSSPVLTVDSLSEYKEESNQ